MKLNLLKNIILATNVISSYNSSLMKDEKKLDVNFSFEWINSTNQDYLTKIQNIEKFVSKFNHKNKSYFVSEYTNFIFLKFKDINIYEKEKILKEIKTYFNVNNVYSNHYKDNSFKKNKSSVNNFVIDNKNSNTFNVMNFNYEERQKILSILENKKNMGKRIKVGVLDDGKIEKKSEYFSDEKDIHLIDNKERFWWFNNNYGDHATKVASVIGGKNGINPYTHLYGIRSFSYNGSSHEIEWLMKNGVKVINLSYYLSNESEYNWASKYLDSLSQNTKNEVTFFIASGNLEDKKYSDVYKKGLLGDGLSYNSIVVGAIRNNDFLEEFSSWRSKTGKKINVVAPDDFSDSDNKYLNGTSFSAPAVAGIVSVLMEIEKDIYAKGLDSIITMSALTASSNYNIWTKNENNLYELSKKVVHDYYGPGKIDFIKMREALQNIEYKILNNGNTSDDVSFKKIYLKKGEKISVGLAWNYNLKNKKNGNPHVHDFDLKIIGPNNFEKSSQMTDNNYERVVFEVPESGEYNFKVKPYESLLHSDEFHVALSFVKF